MALMSAQHSSEAVALRLYHRVKSVKWEKNNMEEDKCYICILFGLMLLLFLNRLLRL